MALAAIQSARRIGTAVLLVLPSVELFKGFHAGGQLQPPEAVARKVVDRLVLAPVENGRTYNYAEL